MTRQYTKKAEHWFTKSSLRELAEESHFIPEVQKEKAALLKSLRESSGLSQRDLASELGVSRTKVFNVENNKSKLSPELEEMIAKVIAERIEFSYIAGLFDRRCSFNIYLAKPSHYNCRIQNGYEIRISFNTKHKILTDILQAVFKNGRVLPRKGTSKVPVHWTFQAFTAEGEEVLEKLLPYLKVKRQLAEIMLELRDLQKQRVKNYIHIGTERLSDDEFHQQAENLFNKFQEVKSLL